MNKMWFWNLLGNVLGWFFGIVLFLAILGWIADKISGK